MARGFQLGLLLLSLVHCSHSPKKSGPSQTSQSPSSSSRSAVEHSSDWRAQMQSLGLALQRLVPATVSESYLRDPANQSRIKKALESIAKQSHELNSQSQKLTLDPTLKSMTGDLRDHAEAIPELLRSNQTKQASRLIRHVVNYCIQCHSQGTGVNSPFKLPPIDSKFHLGPLDQARYYLATRQFDQALIQYEYALADPNWAQQNPDEWFLAFQRMLTIVIRVKRNPSLALEMISRFFDSDSYPQSLRPTAHTWRQQIKSWRSEWFTKKEELSAMTSLKLSRQLLLESDAQKNQNLALMINLRASSEINFYLKTVSVDQITAEAYYLAGRIHKKLDRLELGNLHFEYFRTCANIKPESALTKKCVQSHNAALLERFQVENRQDLPDSVQESLILH